MKGSILIVDDDLTEHEELIAALTGDGHTVHQANGGQKAIEFCRRGPPDVVLLDQRMPEMSGLAVLAQLKREDVDSAVILLTGLSDVAKAVEAMKLGAENFLNKPIDVTQVQIQVQRALEKVHLVRKDRAVRAMAQANEDALPFEPSPATAALWKQLQMLTRSTDTTLLFLGESGSGKGHLARWMHQNGPRRDEPFVELNCASIASNLLEAELFGYEKGAFTDAKTAKKGLVEIAKGGILFLDEVGDLPIGLQPKLLTFLEARRFRRVGGLHEITVDVQIFAATNHDLADQVEKGLFRKDLYFRLNVLPIRIPSLRKRHEDVVLLANRFYSELCRRYGQSPVPLDAQVLELLTRYAWPGNVRELRNILERAFILGGYSRISAVNLPPELQRRQPIGADSTPITALESLEAVERRHILTILREMDGDVQKAAQILEIGRSTLFRKLKEYQLEDKD